MQYVKKNTSYTERKIYKHVMTIVYYSFFFIGITNRLGIVMSIKPENLGFVSDINFFVKQEKDFELKGKRKLSWNSTFLKHISESLISMSLRQGYIC